MDFGKTIIDRMDYCTSEKEYNTGCIEEEHHQRIRVMYESTSLAECYHIVREGLRCPSQAVRDCFDMSGAHWYGGFESFSQVRDCSAGACLHTHAHMDMYTLTYYIFSLCLYSVSYTHLTLPTKVNV